MNTFLNILKDIDTYNTSKGFDAKQFAPFETRHVSSNEEKDAYEIEYSFAGYSKSQIKITATDQLLTVEAKNKKDSKTEKISLNNQISLDHIVAEYTHGLLKLTLPKKGVNEGKQIKIT